ncbi:unnamed protein product [Leptosia nina]|uniref:Serine racemase n=1 Tax=Leptosia nina TaxID=320188 RepID=A0AAV1JP64_9NEOP
MNEEPKAESLGQAPAILAQRKKVPQIEPWCPEPTDIQIDPFCDPYNPKQISYRDIVKATETISQEINKSPLWRSKRCADFGMELYYKIEIFYPTGSYSERKAFYALSMLNEDDRNRGVITASLGNWATALAYYGQRLNISVTVVLPSSTPTSVVGKCHEFGAFVVSYGKNLDEARRQAFVIYDHPDVIAASGSIGIEILNQLPQVDAIVVPVGGGGLLAGIAAAVKHIKPDILVYGVQTRNSRSFFKAMESGQPEQTVVKRQLATSLMMPTAGYNAYNTAKNKLDKMVLVNDDWISLAMLHLFEEEKIVVEGAAAAGLAAFMSIPDILPELKEKTVVCILTGGNVDSIILPRCLERAKAIEGRIIELSVLVATENNQEHLKVLSMIANVGANIIYYNSEKSLLQDNDYDRNYEDFDEFCDPDNPVTITYDDAVNALHRIRKYMPETPYVISHKQKDFAMNIYYKLETVQRTGSFKERGALNALEVLPLDKKKIGIVVASLGNQAMGLCYYGHKLGIPVTVVMPINVPINKLQQCHNLGAKVVVQGGNLTESQRFARAIAREKGLTYINGRDHPDILAGYGTIALEILEQLPIVDAVLVPVGSGGLVAAVAAVIKHVKPDCLVYGVQSEKIPTFFKSLEMGERTNLPWQSSTADSIAMPSIGVNAFHTVKPLLDKMLLVNEDWITRSVLHLVELERLVVEGAAACTLAAILGNLVPEFKNKNVVCILSGGNIDAVLMSRCLDRGLAAEGRLVKFKVSIKDTASEFERLFRYMGNAGFNVKRLFQDRVWVENEIYRVEVKLVCEARHLEHALELKRLMEREYGTAAIFETEPFNEKYTCPCYVRKCCS